MTIYLTYWFVHWVITRGTVGSSPHCVFCLLCIFVRTYKSVNVYTCHCKTEKGNKFTSSRCIIGRYLFQFNAGYEHFSLPIFRRVHATHVLYLHHKYLIENITDSGVGTRQKTNILITTMKQECLSH